ncbi:MAG: hypothetical protein ACRD7E_29950 [Bryobacteraceae bacterium]
MATTTIGFGVALIVLGLGGYFGTGSDSVTALIPAFFGLVLVILGMMARDPGKLKIAMHLAAAVGLLGFLGTVPGLMRIGAVLGGDETVARPNAVIAQAIMAVLTGVFLVICIKSFIDARRRRTTP